VFYLVMGLLPGVLAYVGIWHLREPLMAALGVSSLYAQLSVLLLLTVGWHLTVPFLMLRFVDRLSWRDTVTFLGLRHLDLRGLLTVVPLVVGVFVVLSAPYFEYVQPPLYEWLNNHLPIAAPMPAWHIYSIGYYVFPPAVLAVVIIGNFVGEEVYFHGYLLQKLDGLRIAGLRVHWMVVGALFQLYHVWQLPVNLAFLGLVPIVPFGILVMLRRSLYGSIGFHAFFNLAYFPLIFALFGYGTGQ
jgi:hypothetical protein